MHGWESHFAYALFGKSGRMRAVRVGMADCVAEAIAHLIAFSTSDGVATGCACDAPCHLHVYALTCAPKPRSSACRHQYSVVFRSTVSGDENRCFSIKKLVQSIVMASSPIDACKAALILQSECDWPSLYNANSLAISSGK